MFNRYLNKIMSIFICCKPVLFQNLRLIKSGTKQHLAWLLTDPQAMASYQSIFRHYQEMREIRGPLESWRFSFEPTPMTNWRLHARGRYNASKSHYLVEEIVGIDFDVNLPESVAFINPDFVKSGKVGSCLWF